VTDSDHLKNAKVHLPAGECPSSLFEGLKDPIHIVNIVMDEVADSRILHNDLIKETIWTQCTWDRMWLWWGFCECGLSIPSVFSSLIAGR